MIEEATEEQVRAVLKRIASGDDMFPIESAPRDEPLLTFEPDEILGDGEYERVRLYPPEWECKGNE